MACFEFIACVRICQLREGPGEISRLGQKDYREIPVVEQLNPINTMAELVNFYFAQSS
jgi:hypothetical protein